VRTRRLITTGGLLLSLTTVAGTTLPTAAMAAVQQKAADYLFDFEGGTEGWVAQKDDRVADGTVTWSANRAVNGTRSLEFWMDGLQDEGTMWVQRNLPVPAGRTSVTVDMSFWVWSGADSPVSAWYVVGHAGRTAPTQEDDFTRLGFAEYAGWRQYTYRQTVDARGLSSVSVSFGLSVNWETERVHNFDLVRVAVT
jgi:hypothetical protein